MKGAKQPDAEERRSKTRAQDSPIMIHQSCSRDSSPLGMLFSEFSLLFNAKIFGESPSAAEKQKGASLPPFSAEKFAFRTAGRKGGAFHSFFLHLSKGLFLLNISSLAALLFSPPPSSALQTESGGGGGGKKEALTISEMETLSFFSPLRRPWYGIQQNYYDFLQELECFLKLLELDRKYRSNFICSFLWANYLLFILLAEK